MLKTIINFLKGLFASPTQEEQDKMLAAIDYFNEHRFDNQKKVTVELKDEDLPVYARGKVLPPKAKAKFRAAAKKRK